METSAGIWIGPEAPVNDASHRIRASSGHLSDVPLNRIEMRNQWWLMIAALLLRADLLSHAQRLALFVGF
jgi:hypothetical protein